MEILKFSIFLNFVSFSTIFHKLKRRSTRGVVVWLEEKRYFALASCAVGSPLSLAHKKVRRQYTCYP
jgi:hypothetical protein